MAYSSVSLVLASLLFASALANAGTLESPLRTCTVKIPEGPAMKIELYKNKSVTSQEVFGRVASTEDKVELIQAPVRAQMEKIAKALAKEMMNPNSTTDSTV
ncbi:MAG: hypothetical protein H7333_09900 [Bdellovibrionales bacterium]|nr:hypothetical protein [Oligoflexia bacterium]